MGKWFCKYKFRLDSKDFFKSRTAARAEKAINQTIIVKNCRILHNIKYLLKNKSVLLCLELAIFDWILTA